MRIEVKGGKIEVDKQLVIAPTIRPAAFEAYTLETLPRKPYRPSKGYCTTKW